MPEVRGPRWKAAFALDSNEPQSNCPALENIETDQELDVLLRNLLVRGRA